MTDSVTLLLLLALCASTCQADTGQYLANQYTDNMVLRYYQIISKEERQEPEPDAVANEEYLKNSLDEDTQSGSKEDENGYGIGDTLTDDDDDYGGNGYDDFDDDSVDDFVSVPDDDSDDDGVADDDDKYDDGDDDIMADDDANDNDDDNDDDDDNDLDDFGAYYTGDETDNDDAENEPIVNENDNNEDGVEESVPDDLNTVDAGDEVYNDLNGNEEDEGYEDDTVDVHLSPLDIDKITTALQPVDANKRLWIRRIIRGIKHRRRNKRKIRRRKSRSRYRGGRRAIRRRRKRASRRSYRKSRAYRRSRSPSRRRRSSPTRRSQSRIRRRGRHSFSRRSRSRRTRRRVSRRRQSRSTWRRLHRIINRRRHWIDWLPRPNREQDKNCYLVDGEYQCQVRLSTSMTINIRIYFEGERGVFTVSLNRDGSEYVTGDLRAVNETSLCIEDGRICVQLYDIVSSAEGNDVSTCLRLTQPHWRAVDCLTWISPDVGTPEETPVQTPDQHPINLIN